MQAAPPMPPQRTFARTEPESESVVGHQRYLSSPMPSGSAHGAYWRTSHREDGASVAPPVATDGILRLALPGESVMTLVANGKGHHDQ